MRKGFLGAYGDAVPAVKAQFIGVTGGYWDLVHFYFDDLDGALLGTSPTPHASLINGEQAQISTTINHHMELRIRLSRPSTR
jgi:hypothetical protein